MAEIVGFVLKYSKSLKKTATSQFLLINSNFFFVDLKILGGIIWQVTSLQGGMLVKKGQANNKGFINLRFLQKVTCKNTVWDQARFSSSV